MLLWRIIGISCGVLCATLIFLLIKLKLVKRKYAYEFKRDKLLRINKRDVNRADFVFETSSTTSKFIKEYVLSKDKNKKLFLCEYNKQYKKVVFFILAYDKNGNLLNVLEIRDKKPQRYSRLIKIPRNCNAVNVIVNEIDDVTIEPSVYEQVKASKIVFYSLLESLMITFALFFVEYLMIEIFGNLYKSNYTTSSNMNISFIVLGCIFLINFVATLLSCLYSNRYIGSSGGGSYEF